MLAYLLTVHLAALILINLLGLNAMLAGALSLLFIASLCYYCHCFGWLLRPVQPGQLWVNQQGYWYWTEFNGRQRGPMQLKSSVILGPVIAIYSKPLNAGISRSFIITRDTVTADDWRRLRVRLRDPESWD